MKLNEENGLYFEDVYFSDLSDRAQNFLLKNTLLNTEKQYDLSIKIIQELDEILNRIKDIFKILFIQEIREEYPKEIIFYENVPDSIKKIIKEIQKLDAHIYFNHAPMIENKDFKDYIELMKSRIHNLKTLKNKIDPSIIPFSAYNILKNNISTNENNNIAQNAN